MKKLLTSILVGLIFFAYGQDDDVYYHSTQPKKEKTKVSIPFDSATQKYSYIKIIEVPDKNADSLYQTMKNWVIQKYSDDKFLINTPNEELIHSGTFHIIIVINRGLVKTPFPFTVLFNIETIFKEGKTKLKITNIKLSQNAQGTTQEYNLETFEESMSKVKVFGMSNPIAKKIAADAFKAIDSNMQKLITEIETALKSGVKSKSDW